jgi:hypothetical protein
MQMDSKTAPDASEQALPAGSAGSTFTDFVGPNETGRADEDRIVMASSNSGGDRQDPVLHDLYQPCARPLRLLY